MPKPRKVYFLGPIALIAAILGVMAILRFIRGEVPATLARGSNTQLATHDGRWREDFASVLAQIQKHGGKARYFGLLHKKTPGLFVDLAQWHGTASDFSCLKPLADAAREDFYLSLKETQFGDSEIENLFRFTNAGYIDISNTQITDIGVARLRQALPNVRLIRSDREREELAQTSQLSWMNHLAGYSKAPIESEGQAGNSAAIPKLLDRSKINVLSATTFTYGNQSFRLLGMVEQDEKDVQANAKRFAELWFSSDKSLVQILNITNPQKDSNGAYLVWVDGGGGRNLNRDLIQMNRAKIGHDDFEDYEFYLNEGRPESMRPVFVPWREMLFQASVDYAEGRKPKLSFTWPTN